MLKAVYPGTFDPMTRGHEDICRRASQLFDEVIVAVAENRNKRAYFSLDERVEMVREVLADYPNIQVMGFTCLLTTFMQKQNARVILRGLRAVSDFEYEFALAGMNRNLNPDVETLFLNASEPQMFVSSTMIREISQLGGDVSQFVHPLIKKRLDEKMGKTA